MQVVYADGTEGILSEEDSANLFIQNRFTKEAWMELESEMRKLNIVKFEDPFASKLGADLICIEYVMNHVAAY